MKSTLIFCLLLTFFDVDAQTKRPLLHLAKGQTYYLEDTTISTSRQSIGSRENKVNTTTAFRIAFNITYIADTLYSIEGRYQSLQMQIKLADTTLNMSSKVVIKPDTPSVMMSEIINKPFCLTVAANGKVKSIKNLNELIAKAVSGFPSIGSAEKNKITLQFVQAFGAASVKGILEMGIAVFPATPMVKDDKWVLNSILSSPSPAQVHISYHLAGLSPDIYFVRGEGIITTEKNTKPWELNGMPATYELNGSLLNEIKMNKKTGWVTEVKLKQLIEENIEIADNPKVPGGMTIPMMFTTDMVISGKP